MTKTGGKHARSSIGTVLLSQEQGNRIPTIPPEVTLHGWGLEMSALLLATLMDCPEGCKDAWDCCRLSNIECYVRYSAKAWTERGFFSPWQQDVVAARWSSAQQDTWSGVPEQQGASRSSFVLDTRSSLNVYLGAVQRAPSTLDAAPILRQSYKIFNYCPLNHAAPLNAIRCREGL